MQSGSIQRVIITNIINNNKKITKTLVVFKTVQKITVVFFLRVRCWRFQIMNSFLIGKKLFYPRLNIVEFMNFTCAQVPGTVMHILKLILTLLGFGPRVLYLNEQSPTMVHTYHACSEECLEKKYFPKMILIFHLCPTAHSYIFLNCVALPGFTNSTSLTLAPPPSSSPALSMSSFPP